jgi:hypothetical protein
VVRWACAASRTALKSLGGTSCHAFGSALASVSGLVGLKRVQARSTRAKTSTARSTTSRAPVAGSHTRTVMSEAIDRNVATRSAGGVTGSTGPATRVRPGGRHFGAPDAPVVTWAGTGAAGAGTVTTTVPPPDPLDPPVEPELPDEPERPRDEPVRPALPPSPAAPLPASAAACVLIAATCLVSQVTSAPLVATAFRRASRVASAVGVGAGLDAGDAGGVFEVPDVVSGSVCDAHAVVPANSPATTGAASAAADQRAARPCASVVSAPIPTIATIATIAVAVVTAARAAGGAVTYVGAGVPMGVGCAVTWMTLRGALVRVAPDEPSPCDTPADAAASARSRAARWAVSSRR